jgi:hypothetical protein
VPSALPLDNDPIAADFADGEEHLGVMDVPGEHYKRLLVPHPRLSNASGTVP